MFFAGIILIGVVSLRNLSIDLLPHLEYPRIGVFTLYEGASPEEVERLITKPLESILSSIPGVKRVFSVSKEGVSVISVEFYWGTNMEFAFLKVKEKIEDARNLLPEDSKMPLILDRDPSSMPIVIATFSLKGATPFEDRNSAKYFIKPLLEELDGISRVEVVGGAGKEMAILVDPAKLSLYSIDFKDVEKAVKKWNGVVLGGTVFKDGVKYVLKVKGEIENKSELEKIPVKYISKRAITIGDIGVVKLLKKIEEGGIRYDLKKKVALLIYKEAGGNTVLATKRVRETFKELKKEFKNLNVDIVYEESDLIVNSINSLKKSIIWGSLLAFLVLLIFLQNFKDPLLISVVIPIAIISTFVLMFFAKVNINIMSLGGLALGVGMFVDNSIVVIESIHRKKGEGGSLLAAISGTKEVAGPIFASTLTTVVIFLPVLYVYGVTGKLFRDQALTVSFSLISSLLVSLTLLPSLYNYFSMGERGGEIEVEKLERSKPLGVLHKILTFPLYIFLLLYLILKFLKKILSLIFSVLIKIFTFPFRIIFYVFNFFYGGFENFYHLTLSFLLEKKYVALLLGVLLSLMTVNYYKKVKKELLPEPETNKIEVEIYTPPEWGFKSTDEMARKIEKKIMELKGVRHIFSRVGITSEFGENPEKSSINRIYFLINGDDRKCIVKIRNLLKRFKYLHFSVKHEANTLTRYLKFGRNSIEIKVYYEKLSSVKSVLFELLKRLKKIKGLTDVRTNFEAGKPLLYIKFNEKELELLGISKREVADYINFALKGKVISTLRKVQKRRDILLSTELRYEKDLDKLLSTPFKNGVRLKELISLKRKSSIREIYRDSQERYFSVFANLSGVKLSDVQPEIEGIISSISTPSGVRLKLAGEEAETKRAFKSIYEAIILAVILIYMVMASQFENLLYPLIIMFTLPMGFSGSFFFLHLFGETFNVISGIGLLVVVGIVVNDAIVKVDYTNKLISRGVDVRSALLEASKVKLRPVLMTTFTTIFGLLPMAISRSGGSELQRPLAVVLIGGLLFSTFLTLIFIPILYEWISKVFLKKR